jgi:hypothetical protein
MKPHLAMSGGPGQQGESSPPVFSRLGVVIALVLLVLQYHVLLCRHTQDWLQTQRPLEKEPETERLAGLDKKLYSVQYLTSAKLNA